MKDSKINGLADLKNKKVAVVKDTTTIKTLMLALKKENNNAKIIPVNSAAEGMNAIDKGFVDAFSSDQVVLIGLAVTHKNPEQYAIAKEIFSYEPYALAVRQNDSEFRLLADRVLSGLNRSGKIRSIYERWFGQFTKEIPTLLDAMYILNSTSE